MAYNKWLPPSERIIFTATSIESRDGVYAFLEDLLAQKHQKREQFQPSLLMSSPWGSWSYHSAIHIRPLESVVLRAGQVESVVNDLDQFLNSEAEYVRRAIPWHRGYLFYGPPGAGKTSLAMGLAKHFRMNICYIPLGDMNRDANLIDLVSGVRDRSILLFEDVDVFATATTRKKESGTTSLSGLLNALDGVATPHGLVTIMTTNNRDALDSALVRPGRVDRMEEIGYVDEDQGTRLFSTFYPDATPEAAATVGRACVGMAPAAILEVCKRHLYEPKVAADELVARGQKASKMAPDLQQQ